MASMMNGDVPADGVPTMGYCHYKYSDNIVDTGHFRIRLMNRKFEYIHPDLTMDLEMPLEQAKAENNTFCTRLTAGEYGKLPELFVLTTLTQATDHDEFREVDYIEAWVSAQSRTLTDRIIDDLNEKGVIDDDEVSAEFKRLIDDKGLPEVLKKGKDLILADMFEVNDDPYMTGLLTTEHTEPEMETGQYCVTVTDQDGDLMPFNCHIQGTLQEAMTKHTRFDEELCRGELGRFPQTVVFTILDQLVHPPVEEVPKNELREAMWVSGDTIQVRVVAKKSAMIDKLKEFLATKDVDLEDFRNEVSEGQDLATAIQLFGKEYGHNDNDDEVAP